MIKRTLKKVTKSTILTIFKNIVYCRAKNGDECVLLSSHIPIQNLGDQALLCGSIEGLKRFSTIHVIQTGFDDPKIAAEKSGLDVTGVEFYSCFRVLFSSSKSFKERLSFLAFISKFENCYAIGADVLDGTYNLSEALQFFDVVNDIADVGTKINVIGASFSKEIAGEVKNKLSSLNERVTVYCRDLYSLERISGLCSAKLSADAAFLMSPAEQIKSYTIEGLDREGNAEHLVIGVCLKSNDLDSRDKLNDFCNALKKLCFENTNSSVIFLPHHENDYLTSIAIRDRLRSCSAEIILPGTLPAANEIKKAAGCCSVVITGRMHVAIAALGMGVIPICYPYGDKFEGLLSHFGLESSKLMVTEDQSNLMSCLIYCFSNRSTLKATTNRKKDGVIRLAEKNF